ncbi:MAG: arylsulfatase [Verrucomicrobia bacterium]|nr:arylsulfatase [Verrucomicrobiota bacterium]
MKRPLLSLALVLCALHLVAAEAPRPNVVFFLIDDLGYADCGFNGGKEIRTPEIDALANGGAVIESHYVQPVCSPTRSALMTGRYPTRTGVYTVVRPGAKWGLPLNERTLANALKDAGYTTAITGKWHLGEFDPAYKPTARGFDHQYGHYFGAIDYFTHLRDGQHDWHRDDVEVKEEGYSTHLVAKEACRLIEAQEKGKPLFLYVPFNGVHSPMQVPDSYLEPYATLEGPRRQLAGMLAAVDEAIGQIVDALEKSGRRENTLIVFSSDNGGPRPGTNKPLRDYKGTIHEGGVRAAAFANWPGKIPAGQRIEEPMHIIDWYPTLVKLAGGTLEGSQPLDGRDVWPMLTAQAPSPHEFILSAQSPRKAALRVGNWKLILQPGETGGNAKGKAKGKAKNKGKAASAAEPVALYDLAADPEESTNLAAREPERVAELRTKLEELLKNAVPPGEDAAGAE